MFSSGFDINSIWIFIWFLLNISLTLLNKGMMVFFGFKFPILISFIHMLFSTYLGWIISADFDFIPQNDKFKDIRSQPDYEKKSFMRICLLSFIFTLNIIFGNISLKYCSVAFVQVVRAIIPLITMILSIIFLKAHYSFVQWISCMVICIGVAFSCFGEINLTLTGLFVTVFGCFLSSLKSISIKMTLSGQYELHSLDLLSRMSPISAIEMFFLAIYKNEPQQIRESSKYEASIYCFFGVMLSGVIAFFLNLTNFLATAHTSPLTVTIVGCIKQVFTIVLSVLIFDKRLTMLNWIGIVITTLGSLWYSLIKLQKPPPKPQPQPQQDIVNEPKQ
ncbi:putative phosphate translocator [Tritrichomonas foetus]|uniref:Phosphate translocator n=1 Tax=Tritrichomonas foetus TaxID=1144522 RepID=A0A1J4KM23_9EUKA|nr:putative phosphate translocator [Tritrichomonas foetus]|eukprot:OHT10742.1 putative phosphate translocator [Tritrichomonas foetus]